jgi:hypothetical protein
MKAKDFVETEEAKFVLQLKGMWNGLVQIGAQLGFSNTEIDDAEKDYRWMEYVVNRNRQVQKMAEAYTSFKNTSRKGKKNPGTEPQLPPAGSVPTMVNGNIERRFRKRAAKAKAHPNYSPSQGELLRIVAPQQVFDTLNAVPKFKVLFTGGHPHIKFRKKHFHGFEIWKDDGSGWKKFDRATRSPYIDKSKLPPYGQAASWAYKLIGFVNDELIGKESSEAHIVVSG